MPTIEQGIGAWSGSAANNPPVIVWVISIDDDPAQLNGKIRPTVHRPGLFSLGSKANDTTLTEMSREALTLHQNGVDCYGRTSPTPGVGAHAATGWLLSKTVRTYDLAGSLTSTSQNAQALKDVRAFLDGSLSDPSSCPLQPPS